MKAPKIKFLKVRLVGAELFYADGRTAGWTHFSPFFECAWKVNINLALQICCIQLLFFYLENRYSFLCYK
jgi:hypothetical protein